MGDETLSRIEGSNVKAIAAGKGHSLSKIGVLDLLRTTPLRLSIVSLSHRKWHIH